ncbi:MAG: hypothetical protein ACFFBU_06590, partial [Promethearchaeota archaeon]
MTKIGFFQLNSCSGCMFAVLSSTIFLDLLKSADIRLFRLISDVQTEDQFDVVFIEGGVTRN